MAHILDCSPNDVVELARGKNLKGTKQGRFWRFRPTDLEAYMRKKGK